MTEKTVTVLTVSGYDRSGVLHETGRKTYVLSREDWVVDPHVAVGDAVYFLPHNVRTHGIGRISKDATDAVVSPEDIPRIK